MSRERSALCTLIGVPDLFVCEPPRAHRHQSPNGTGTTRTHMDSAIRYQVDEPFANISGHLGGDAAFAMATTGAEKIAPGAHGDAPPQDSSPTWLRHGGVSARSSVRLGRGTTTLAPSNRSEAVRLNTLLESLSARGGNGGWQQLCDIYDQAFCAAILQVSVWRVCRARNALSAQPVCLTRASVSLLSSLLLFTLLCLTLWGLCVCGACLGFRWRITVPNVESSYTAFANSTSSASDLNATPARAYSRRATRFAS